MLHLLYALLATARSSLKPLLDYNTSFFRNRALHTYEDQPGGDSRDEALEQLVTVAKQRFGTKRVTLLGNRSAQERLAQLAEERGLEIAEERQR